MKNYKIIAETALLAGEIMLRSGAETYRVEDTISRILKTSGLEKTECFVAGTGIIATLDDTQIDAITMVKRVEQRDTNLFRIAKANDISRKLCSGEMKIKFAYTELLRIKNEEIYSKIITNLCIIGTATFFCALIGGGLWDCVCAALNGVVLLIVGRISKKIKLRKFIDDMISSFFIAVISMLLYFLLGERVSQDAVIIGSIMPLLPGVAFTNAIRDTLQGDYMSGVSRAMEAIVVALSIGVGIGSGLSIYNLIINYIYI